LALDAFLIVERFDLRNKWFELLILICKDVMAMVSLKQDLLGATSNGLGPKTNPKPPKDNRTYLANPEPVPDQRVFSNKTDYSEIIRRLLVSGWNAGSRADAFSKQEPAGTYQPLPPALSLLERALGVFPEAIKALVSLPHDHPAKRRIAELLRHVNVGSAPNSEAATTSTQHVSTGEPEENTDVETDAPADEVNQAEKRWVAKCLARYSAYRRNNPLNPENLADDFLLKKILAKRWYLYHDKNSEFTTSRFNQLALKLRVYTEAFAREVKPLITKSAFNALPFNKLPRNAFLAAAFEALETPFKPEDEKTLGADDEVNETAETLAVDTESQDAQGDDKIRRFSNPAESVALSMSDSIRLKVTKILDLLLNDVTDEYDSAYIAGKYTKSTPKYRCESNAETLQHPLFQLIEGLTQEGRTSLLSQNDSINWYDLQKKRECFINLMNHLSTYFINYIAHDKTFDSKNDFIFTAQIEQSHEYSPEEPIELLVKKIAYVKKQKDEWAYGWYPQPDERYYYDKLAEEFPKERCESEANALEHPLFKIIKALTEKQNSSEYRSNGLQSLIAEFATYFVNYIAPADRLDFKNPFITWAQNSITRAQRKNLKFAEEMARQVLPRVSPAPQLPAMTVTHGGLPDYTLHVEDSAETTVKKLQHALLVDTEFSSQAIAKRYTDKLAKIRCKDNSEALAHPLFKIIKALEASCSTQKKEGTTNPEMLTRQSDLIVYLADTFVEEFAPTTSFHGNSFGILNAQSRYREKLKTEAESGARK
jgi:hypothetical protein